MRHFWIIYCFVTIQTWEVSSITTRIEQNQPVRNFRRHAGPPPPGDWELGLREAVHQALLREHNTDPGLRDHLLEAPLIGRQDNASPFGDIAVLARGQLYATAEGYKFLQDQDDCDDCVHSGRCARAQCQLWKTLGHHHKLLALWTVKRIRHRDRHYGHVFEIEYTISPITSAINEDLVKRHGYFNYNVPGHIFVIKSDPRLNSGYYLNNADKHSTGDEKWHKNHATEQYPGDQLSYMERGSAHFRPGILIGVSPDGYKHVLHSFPGFYSSYHPQTSYNDQTTIDPKEYELYKKLIESLASKTTHSHVPHRFGATTPKDRTIVPATKPSTYHQLTTFVPSPQTTFVQFPDGQLVPLTEKTPPTTTKKYQDQNLHIVTPIKFPTTAEPTHLTKYSEPDLFYHTLPTDLPMAQPSKPATTIHYYAPVEELERPSKPSITTPNMKPFTTIADEIFSTPSKPRKKVHFTSRKTTQATLPDEAESDLFPVNTSTEPMRPVTEIPEGMRQTISEQLPPPNEDTDTTIPYVSSTVTQPSVKKTEKATIATATTPVKNELYSTVTQKITTLAPYISPEDRTISVIERVPYNEDKTTTFTTTETERVPTASGREETVTASVIEIIPEDRSTTVIEKIPFTTEERSTVTISRVPTTELTSTDEEKTSTIFTENLASTRVEPTIRTSTYTRPVTKPTTIVEYSLDSTTKGYTLESTIGTGPLTETPTTIYFSTKQQTTQLPTTETTKYTVPPMTTHYYYTFDSEIPTTSTVRTTDGIATTHFTETVTPAITSTIAHTTGAEQESTIPIQQTTKYKKKTKPTRPTSSTIDDFLTDAEADKRPNTLTSKKDFDEDDIFGKTPIKSSTEPTKSTTRKVTPQSDLAQALFGDRRRKQIKLSSKVTRKRRPKIIYTNFYAPSTEATRGTTLETTKRTPYDTTTSFDGTTEFRPFTDQSYSTSISVEVNKRNNTRPIALHLQPVIVEVNKRNNTSPIALHLESMTKAKLTEVVNHKGDYKVYKAELPEDVEGTKVQRIDNGKNDTNKVFDDFALQLVNHARSIDYLHKKPSRQPKYKRRNSTTKNRRSRKRNPK